MASDDKITQVGNISRSSPVRNVASRTETLASAVPRVAAEAAPAPLPVARLIGLARELSEQPPPVDHARISALRNAIANGAYAVDAALVAKAVARFYHGGA